MGCGPNIVPGFNESNKIKDPGLEMKINQLFHAQGNPKTGEIEYRESNTASVLEELSRQPGELGQMSRYLKDIGVEHDEIKASSDYDPKIEEAVGSVFAEDKNEDEYGDDNELVY